MRQILLHAFSCCIYFASIKDIQYFIDYYFHFTPLRDMLLHTIVLAVQAQLGDYVHLPIRVWLNCFHINQHLTFYSQKRLKSYDCGFMRIYKTFIIGITGSFE